MLYVTEFYYHKKSELETADTSLCRVSYNNSLDKAVEDIDCNLRHLFRIYECEYGEDDDHDLEWFKSICLNYYNISINITEVHNLDMMYQENALSVLRKYNIRNPEIPESSAHLSKLEVKNVWDELMSQVTYWYDIYGNQTARYECNEYLGAFYRPYEKVLYKEGSIVNTPSGIGTIVSVPNKYSSLVWQLSYNVDILGKGCLSVNQNEITLVE